MIRTTARTLMATTRKKLSKPSIHGVEKPCSQTTQLALLAFAFFLSLYLPLAAIVPRAITNLASPMLLLGVIFGWRGGRSLSRETWVLVAGFALFFLGGMLSLVNNQNWDFASWRFEKYYPFLLIPLAFSFLAQDQIEDRQIQVLFWATIVASFSIATFAFFQDDPRAGLGKNLNPNRFGAYACWVSAVIAAAVLTLKRTAAFLTLLTGAFTASCYAGLASGSRGSLLALICALCTLLVAWLFKPFVWKKVWVGLGGLALLAASLTAVVWEDGSWRTHLDAGVENTTSYLEGKRENTSIGIRLMMWTGAFEIWRAHPWIGTGLGDSQDDLAAWIKESGSVLKHAYSRFHNIYFDSLASTGAVGFMTMLLGVLLLPLRYFLLAYYRAPPASWAEFSALAGTATIVLYAVAGLTGSWLFNRGLPPYLVAVVVLVSGTNMFKRPHPPSAS